MRYYSLVITDPATGQLIVPDLQTRQFKRVAPSAVAATYTSIVNGRTDPGALNIELDIPVSPQAAPTGNAFVKVWGVSLVEIGQASNLNGMLISVFGGMAKGLRLANPAQQGLLVQGMIFQAFGNWQGIEQSLDLIITPATNSGTLPSNITMNWVAGMPLATAIQNTLAVAFPGVKANINISPNLVLNHTEPGYWNSIGEFASWVKEASRNLIGGDYPGVDIVLQQNTLIVYDSTTPKNPKAIAFQDMIGQPTWKGPLTMNASLVMRGDLAVGSYVQMPPSLFVTTAASFSQFRQKSAFTGVFQISAVHHFGNFRQPDARSWVTTIDAVIPPT